MEAERIGAHTQTKQHPVGDVQITADKTAEVRERDLVIEDRAVGDAALAAHAKHAGGADVLAKDVTKLELERHLRKTRGHAGSASKADGHRVVLFIETIAAFVDAQARPILADAKMTKAHPKTVAEGDVSRCPIEACGDDEALRGAALVGVARAEELPVA